MLERVLIPLDGSPESESILPLLQPILLRAGSEVFLAQALHQAPAYAGSHRAMDALQEADRYLARVIDRHLGSRLCAHAFARFGPPHQVIESLAVEEEITLVAMALPPEESEPAFGSVPDRLLREGNRPLLAFRTTSVRPGEVEARAGLGTYTRLLVPQDGTEWARRSLPLAIELARILEAHVILLRVLDRRSPSSREPVETLAEEAPWGASADEQRAMNDLQEISDRLNREGIVTEIWVESGDPSSEILRLCRGGDVQLAVMTTHGRCAPPRQIMGSVLRRVMRESPIPVLAYHDCESEDPGR